MWRLLEKGGRILISHPYGSYLHNLPHHYNGGFTHAWFEYHMLGKHAHPKAGEKKETYFAELWWNYHWESVGQTLTRVMNEFDCLEPHLGNFVGPRVFSNLLVDVIPDISDTLPGLCSGAE